MVIDMAFVGMEKGVHEDFAPFRSLSRLQGRMPWFFAVSYSKCFALYNERIGSLSVIASGEDAASILEHMTFCARSCYSSPPSRGGKIVVTLLLDSELSLQWLREIQFIAEDIKNRRKLLVDTMASHQGLSKNQIEELTNRSSIFLDSQLRGDQIATLRESSSLYLLKSGWLNILTIPVSKMQSVARCFADAICSPRRSLPESYTVSALEGDSQESISG